MSNAEGAPLATALPVPEVRRATLVSEGVRKPTWTTHFYVETRQLDSNDAHKEVFEFIYECFITGQRRRWGLIVRDIWEAAGN